MFFRLAPLRAIELSRTLAAHMQQEYHCLLVFAQAMGSLLLKQWQQISLFCLVLMYYIGFQICMINENAAVQTSKANQTC